MLHWLNVELWGPMWPNIFAPSAVTLVAIVVSHMLHRKAMATHMDHLRTHIAERLNVHHAEMGKQLAAHCTDVKEHGPVVPPPATGHRRGERM